MFALWPGDWLNFSTFKQATFGYGGQTAASEAGHIANTNVGRNYFMTKILLLIFVLTYNTASGQYPFDKFAKPDFKLYNDWKAYDKTDKMHETITVPNFYQDSSSLTIQFTLDKSKAKNQNVIRIYKDKTAIQSFRSELVDFYLSYASTYPIRVGDLNGDRLLDIKIIYDYHSNGLALSFRPIYLIQGEKGFFKKYSFDNMFEDRIDLERDLDSDGKFEIQSVRLVQQNNHSYWCFEIFQIEDSSLAAVSDKFHYPIFVQFLNKRNYKQADIKLDRDANWTRDLNIVVDTGTVLK